MTAMSRSTYYQEIHRDLLEAKEVLGRAMEKAVDAKYERYPEDDAALHARAALNLAEEVGDYAGGIGQELRNQLRELAQENNHD